MSLELLPAALDVLAQAALLEFLVVPSLPVTDGDLGLVCRRGGVLVPDGALEHARLALESRRLLNGGAHSTAGAPLHQRLGKGTINGMRECVV